MNKQSERLITLELKIFSKKKLRPQKWCLLPGLPFNLTFPSVAPSIRQLQFSNKSLSGSRLRETEANTLRKRKMFPLFHSGWRYTVYCLNLSKVSLNRETRRFLLILNKIFKDAKNLKSLISKARSGILNLKGIRQARNLQELSLKIDTDDILAYPQLFKYLPFLQKAQLFVKWSSKDHHENPRIDKFFGFLLNLPKLWHLTLWLEDSLDYCKTLLFAIGKRNLPSFQINVQGMSEIPLKNCQIAWRNCIESLFLGSKQAFCKQSEVWERWPHAKFPKKMLRLNSSSKIDDLIELIFTIKNIEILDLFYCQGNPSVENVRKVLTLISKTKTLEKLTLTLERTYTNSREVRKAFNKEFSLIETLENLETFRFELEDGGNFFPLISPPYDGKMKNLKTLSLVFNGHCFNLPKYAEALKFLVSLENFYWTYNDSKKDNEVDCKFPLKNLKNLKLFWLYCNRPFGESSIENFILSVSGLEKLESLKIFGKILQNLDRKASAVAKQLCKNERLEAVGFEWKEAQNVRTFVDLQKADGEWVTSVENQEK